MENPNLNYIDELADGNHEFKTKIIGILKKELPNEIKGYTEEIENSNFLAAAQSVHKLKHKISVLGLEKSYYIAEEYENNLKNNGIKLADDFESILKVMQDFVHSL